VATLAELARLHTRCTKEQIAHLQRFVTDWGILADLCFADLLLYVPTTDRRWLVLDHVRPVTSQTIYVQDWVGSIVDGAGRPALVRAFDSGLITDGDIDVDIPPAKARTEAIPVQVNGEVTAVLTREWSPTGGRQPGELERTYLAVFRRFVTMITEGTFPYPFARRSTDASPRVGDGAIVLDATGRVDYSSPNAVSALHRAGINANAVGLRLAELGFNDAPVRAALDTMEPVVDEFEQTVEVTLLVRCLPLLSAGRATGALMLLRDVSELRRRDRLLLSKDATIREIHHRVKNNLQTISSLLRLQGRRLTSPEAKEAIDESVRRIRTIALVHETLSREAGDDVPFIDIVRPLTRMAEESLQSPDRPVRFRVIGDGGKVPANIATPLAVVLTELLQNAVDHAFGERASQPGTGTGSVVVSLVNDRERLEIRVVDDGHGLPPGFSLDAVTGLGLSIVRTLVTTELGGSIEMRSATASDLAEAQIAEPQGLGTVVELVVPAVMVP
jgi:two-component system, sensor histidine kinase PdtaS